MTDISYNETLAVLTRLIEAAPKDYVYEYADNDCVYFMDSAPSCGVGHVLASCGVTASQVPPEKNTLLINLLWGFFKEELGLNFDYKSKILLMAFQTNQDAGIPWKESLEQARKMASLCL